MHKVFYYIILVALIASCKSPEARRPEQRVSGSFIKQSAERNKELYQKEEAFITQIIAQSPETTFVSSPNGFWYFYNKKDTLASAMPKKGDIVTFTYNVKDLNGTTIVTEAENGLQQYQVDQSNQELISGIRDGIKLMKAGEIITFIFPSYKAYGYYGIEEKLATNTPIQSTVTLQSIEPTETN